MLPAISLDRWQAREGGAIDAPLRNFLVAARAVWRRALPAVPRVPLSPDPSADLLRVLAMAPVAIGYATRRAARLLQIATAPPPAPDSPPPPPTGNLRAQQMARDLGLTWIPRHVRAILAANPPAGRVAGALVQPPAGGATIETLSETQPLPQPSYLRLLADAGNDKIRNQKDELATPPNALLYVLLRQAALHEYLGAAFRILRRRNAVTPEARREPEATDGATATPWDLLARTWPMPACSRRRLPRRIKARLRAEASSDAAAPGAIWRRNVYEVAAGPAATPTSPRTCASSPGSFAASTTWPVARRRSSAASSRKRSTSAHIASTPGPPPSPPSAWSGCAAVTRNARGVYLGGYGWVEDLAPTPRQNATLPTVTHR